MRLKSIVTSVEGLSERLKAYGRPYRGNRIFFLWITVICLVLPLSGCREEALSAREVLEQVCANMDGMSEVVFMARVEMVMSVYGETMQLEARSRVRASFLTGHASESVELYRNRERAESFTYRWEEQEVPGAIRDAADIGRFLKDTEVFFIEGEEDAETIYTIEGLVNSDSLGGMEDLERMAALLPVLEPGDWQEWARGHFFPVRIKVDRETLLPVEAAVNVSEAVKAPVLEGICALGISEDQVQAGSCVITYDYEEFEREK